MKKMIGDELSDDISRDFMDLNPGLLLVYGIFGFALLEVSQCLGQMVI